MPRLPRGHRNGFRLPTAPNSLQGRSKNRPVRVRFGTWLNRNRRLGAALLLCAAAAVAVQQLTPAPLSTATALAAARDLPAGSVVTPADLARIQVPPAMVADGILRDNGAAASRQLAAPVRKGQLLTDTQFLGPGLLAGTPPGSAAVPLRMADAASIQLVSPGQLVNVVLTSANGFDQRGPSEVLASAVPVLWTSNTGGQGGQWLGTSETDGLMVVAATAEQSARLAGASTQGRLFFVLVSPP